jgi:hypothetical protein
LAYPNQTIPASQNAVFCSRPVFIQQILSMAVPEYSGNDREQTNASVSLKLLGLDHPFVAKQLQKWQSLPPEELGLCVQSPDGRQGVLSVWRIESRDGKGRTQARIVSIACGTDNVPRGQQHA